MRRTARKALAWLRELGLEPVKTRSALPNIALLIREYEEFRKQNENLLKKWRVSLESPCLHDRFDPGGSASGHYFHQDLLVARRIYERNPTKHVDVGSRIDGFVAHVAVFRYIEVIDIRPQPVPVHNIKFITSDLMVSSSVPENYCDSISCLHALEHFGLGRYGDKIDVLGYEKGFESLSKMLITGGTLYLSLPVGKERVEFNGQRIFSVARLEEMFKGQFRLAAFSYVDDDGDLHENVDLDTYKETVAQLEYGCGIFELVKN
jgi:hypothetical protein